MVVDTELEPEYMLLPLLLLLLLLLLLKHHHLLLLLLLLLEHHSPLLPGCICCMPKRPGLCCIIIGACIPPSICACESAIAILALRFSSAFETFAEVGRLLFRLPSPAGPGPATFICCRDPLDVTRSIGYG